MESVLIFSCDTEIYKNPAYFTLQHGARTDKGLQGDEVWLGRSIWSETVHGAYCGSRVVRERSQIFLCSPERHTNKQKKKKIETANKQDS